eukprot:1607292-Ditylum_brightwellii.AAC.1
MQSSLLASVGGIGSNNRQWNGYSSDWDGVIAAAMMVMGMSIVPLFRIRLCLATKKCSFISIAAS